MAESKKKYLYAEGANGMVARVPEDKLSAWQEAQDKQKAGEQPGRLAGASTPSLETEEDRQMLERLMSLMRGKAAPKH